MDLSSLPPKGEKRIQAISALGEDSKNVDILFTLANTEKGNAKQVALKCLTKFDYPPAIPLWKKQLKTKSKGEKILMESTADSISEITADEIYSFLSKIFQNPDGYCFTDSESGLFKTYISLMLGKASSNMQNVYRLVAQNMDKFISFTIERDPDNIFINSYLRFRNPSREDKSKIFPAVLTMSMVKNPDYRLTELANELYHTYQSGWLSPFFMKALLTQPAKQVFEEFSNYIHSESAIYIYETLGALYFDKENQKHIALLFWGQYKYGEIDSRITFNRFLWENLDRKWFSLLTSHPQEEKISVALQSYNRGGVLYNSYNEMLAEIIPYPVNDKAFKTELSYYFTEQEKIHNGASSLYIDTLYNLGYEIDENVMTKYINCKDNAASIYSLQSMLQRTNWSTEKRLAFFDSVSSQLSNVEDTIQSCRDKIA